MDLKVDDSRSISAPAARVEASGQSEDRLVAGGSLIFSTALLVQLLQLTTLSTPLWVALFATAIAIPSSSAVLVMIVGHHEFDTVIVTRYRTIANALSAAGVLVCAASLFWHFSSKATILFLVLSFSAFILFGKDYDAQKEVARQRNAPKPLPGQGDA